MLSRAPPESIPRPEHEPPPGACASGSGIDPARRLYPPERDAPRCIADRNSDVPEIAAPSLAGCEAGRALGAPGCFHLAVPPFQAKGVAFGQTVLRASGTAIGSHAALRKAADVVGQGLGLRACFALGHDVLAKADPQRLVGVHPATGQDEAALARFMAFRVSGREWMTVQTAPFLSVLTGIRTSRRRMPHCAEDRRYEIGFGGRRAP